MSRTRGLNEQAESLAPLPYALVRQRLLLVALPDRKSRTVQGFLHQTGDGPLNGYVESLAELPELEVRVARNPRLNHNLRTHLTPRNDESRAPHFEVARLCGKPAGPIRPSA